MSVNICSPYLLNIYGLRVGIDCSKLRSNCQVIINLQKWFSDMKILIFFPDVDFYSIKVIGSLIPLMVPEHNITVVICPGSMSW